MTWHRVQTSLGLTFLLLNSVDITLPDFILGSDCSSSSFWPSPTVMGRGRSNPLPVLSVPSQGVGPITGSSQGLPLPLAPDRQRGQEGRGRAGPEGLTQCSSHPAWSPAVGGVPAQARWGSQRIPSPCHKLPWAGTPAHSNHLATARAARPRSPHAQSHTNTLTLTTLSRAHTLSLIHSHPHTHTHSPSRKPERRQNLFCWPSQLHTAPRPRPQCPIY